MIQYYMQVKAKEFNTLEDAVAWTNESLKILYYAKVTIQPSRDNRYLSVITFRIQRD